MAIRVTGVDRRAEEKIEAVRELRLLGVRAGSTVYTTVLRVSRTGTSRHVRVFVVVRVRRRGPDGRNRSTHEIRDVTGLVARACGYPLRRGDLLVHGCGMDMCVSVVHRLGGVMFPRGGPLELSQRYHQERRGGADREINGEYLLRNETL